MTDSKNMGRTKEIICFTWAKTVDERMLNALSDSPEAWSNRIPKNFSVSDDIENGGVILKGSRASGEAVITGHMALVRTQRELTRRVHGGPTPAGVRFPAVVLTHPHLPRSCTQLLRSLSLVFTDLMRVDGKPVAEWINQVEYGDISANTRVLKRHFGDVIKLRLQGGKFDWEWKGDFPFMSHLPSHLEDLGPLSVYAQEIYG